MKEMRSALVVGATGWEVSVNAEKTANKKTEQPGFLTSVLEG